MLCRYYTQTPCPEKASHECTAALHVGRFACQHAALLATCALIWPATTHRCSEHTQHTVTSGDAPANSSDIPSTSSENDEHQLARRSDAATTPHFAGQRVYTGVEHDQMCIDNLIFHAMAPSGRVGDCSTMEIVQAALPAGTERPIVRGPSHGKWRRSRHE